MTKKRLSSAIWTGDRWVCRVQHDGHRRAFYSSTPGRRGKREAEDKADQWLAAGAVDPQTRVRDIFAAFIAHEEARKGKDSPSVKLWRREWATYILPLIGAKRLEAMRRIDWQDCIDIPYHTHGLRRGSLLNIRGALTALHAYLADRGVYVHELTNLKIPDGAVNRPHQILQPDDLAKLFDPAHDDHPLINLWRTMVLTGLRPGEAIGLQWADIRGQTLTVSRAVNVSGEVTPGKNRNARRSFLLPDRAKAVLEAQRNQLRRRGIVSPWVFPGKDGDALSQKSARTAWAAFTAANGITPCTPYELRHTMVSVNTDTPDVLLKAMVGHSSTMDTRGVYGHEIQGNRERTAAIVGAAFDAILMPLLSKTDKN